MKTIVMVVVALIAVAVVATLGTSGSYTNRKGVYKKASGTWSYFHLMNHPLFCNWGEEMFDWNNPVIEKVIQPLNMNYVSLCMGLNKTMMNSGLNFLIEKANEGKYQHLDYYSEEEKKTDSSKDCTGLVYIPGDSTKPFAVVAAGGAYKCVAMAVEGFPIAKTLSEQGYPVFVLKYRISRAGNQIDKAYEDLGNAMTYILSHQQELGLSNAAYSLWGFSAGGNLIYNYTEGEKFTFEHFNLPAPAMLALGYGAVWEGDPLSPDFSIRHPEVKTYMVYGKNDGVIGDKGVIWAQKYEQYLSSIGSVVRYDLYDNAPHGFGDGTGTDAAGWILNALDLLEHAE